MDRLSRLLAKAKVNEYKAGTSNRMDSAGDNRDKSINISVSGDLHLDQARVNGNGKNGMNGVNGLNGRNGRRNS